jgi:hypothetical protein
MDRIREFLEIDVFFEPLSKLSDVSFVISGGAIGIIVTLIIVVQMIRNKRPPSPEQVLRRLILRFDLLKYIKQLTLVHKNTTRGNVDYETMDYEITLKYDEKDIFKSPIRLYRGNSVIVSYKKIKNGIVTKRGELAQSYQNVELCLLLFIENTLKVLVSSDRRLFIPLHHVHEYRVSKYKWNVGRQAYVVAYSPP